MVTVKDTFLYIIYYAPVSFISVWSFYKRTLCVLSTFDRCQNPILPKP